jgi:hypothetical protein
MRRKSSFYIFGILIFFLSGCATDRSLSYRHIRRSMVFVEKRDGILEEEAAVLAQNLILDKGLADRLYSLKPIGFEKKEVWSKDGEVIEFGIYPRDQSGYQIKRSWFVLFRDKEGSLLMGAYPVIPFYVEVNADNGVIEGWGLKK